MSLNIRLRVFHGPSVHAPFAAVIAEFTNAFKVELPASVIESQWCRFSKRPLWNTPDPSVSLSFEGLARILAIRFQHPDDPESATVRVIPGIGSAASFIALGFTDPSASAMVLRAAIDLAEGFFLRANGKLNSLVQFEPRLQEVNAALRRLPLEPIIRTLIHAARRRAIPVYPVAESSRIWLFGQGATGFHFFEAAGERDSFTGMRLAQDKTLSNRLVRRLGFPGVAHGIAVSAERAVRIARQLGYPVVVKPIALGKGEGVSAYVLNDAEVAMAYSSAATLSPQGVIVERHVGGNDHRLAVFGGRLAWVAARYPACVTGDGHSTIAELINEENRRRREEPAAAEGGLLQIEADADMLLHLRKQGFTLDSRPPAGATTNLRSVANISKGGTLADVTHLVHPDNVYMAEAIARSFRMDAFGIDFMTPDISRSWRHVPCAVIEVNGTPGIFFDARAERILQAKFPAGSDGRIPSVLLIDAPDGVATRVCNLLSAKGRAVGQTGEDYTLLNGYIRCQEGEDLSTRVMALVSDPGCEALVIETSAQSLGNSGLPLDRFDLALGLQVLPPDLRSLVQSCCVTFADAHLPEAAVASLVEAVLDRYANAGAGAWSASPGRVRIPVECSK